MSNYLLFVLELKYCETNNVTCQNGATCVSLPEEDGNYRCLCADGYIGRNCEVDKKKVPNFYSSEPIYRTIVTRENKMYIY